MRRSPCAASLSARPVASGARTHGALRALPWPPARLSVRQARAPHRHRCLACSVEFDCPGPDETGFCAPVCAPCYWIELGSQLKAYQEVIAALSRKRRDIERRVGAHACRAARLRRRRFAVSQGFLTGFGAVVGLKRKGSATRASEPAEG